MNDAAIVELLREILDEIRALPAAIAAAIERQHRTPRRLSQADGAALAALIPAIAAAVGNRTFSVRELIEHAKLDLAAPIALRGVLESIGAPRRIGRLFRRGCDNDVGGYRIKAVCSSRDGVRWVVECDDRSPQKHARFATPKQVRF